MIDKKQLQPFIVFGIRTCSYPFDWFHVDGPRMPGDAFLVSTGDACGVDPILLGPSLGVDSDSWGFKLAEKVVASMVSPDDRICIVTDRRKVPAAAEYDDTLVYEWRNPSLSWPRRIVVETEADVSHLLSTNQAYPDNVESLVSKKGEKTGYSVDVTDLLQFSIPVNTLITTKGHVLSQLNWLYYAQRGDWNALYVFRGQEKRLECELLESARIGSDPVQVLQDHFRRQREAVLHSADYDPSTVIEELYDYHLEAALDGSDCADLLVTGLSLNIDAAKDTIIRFASENEIILFDGGAMTDEQSLNWHGERVPLIEDDFRAIPESWKRIV